MSINTIKNAVSNAASTVQTTAHTAAGKLKAGKDFAVTQITQNPAKTAIISGTSGLALAGACVAFFLLVGATGGIALAVFAGLALAFAAYNAVKACMANKVEKAPVIVAEQEAIALKANKQLSSSAEAEVLMSELTETTPVAISSKWKTAGKAALVAAAIVSFGVAASHFAPTAFASL